MTASCRSSSPPPLRLPAARRTLPRAETTELAEQLRTAGDTVRTSIGGMRSLLVDIYPANLRAAGLAPALRDLAATVRAGVTVEVSDEAAQTRSPPNSKRRCSEWLKSACAMRPRTPTRARSALCCIDDSAAVVLAVADDGVGFDPSTTRPEGHFGLP